MKAPLGRGGLAAQQHYNDSFISAVAFREEQSRLVRRMHQLLLGHTWTPNPLSKGLEANGRRPGVYGPIGQSPQSTKEGQRLVMSHGNDCPGYRVGAFVLWNS